MFSLFKLTDSPLGLIIVETAFAIPFCIWLLRSFFDTIPLDLEESAMIDGASDYQAFMYITFPLSAAGIATAAIYTCITSWGEYIFSSIFLITDTKKTVPLGIVTYMGDMYIEWGKLVAGSVLRIIPVLILLIPWPDTSAKDSWRVRSKSDSGSSPIRINLQRRFFVVYCRNQLFLTPWQAIEEVSSNLADLLVSRLGLSLEDAVQRGGGYPSLSVPAGIR